MSSPVTDRAGHVARNCFSRPIHDGTSSSPPSGDVTRGRVASAQVTELLDVDRAGGLGERGLLAATSDILASFDADADTAARGGDARGGDGNFGIKFSPRAADTDTDFAGAVTLLSTDSFARDTPTGTPRAAVPRGGDGGASGAGAPRAPREAELRRAASAAVAAAAAGEQDVPLSLLPYYRFLNERGQASIMNQLVAQFSRTSIEGAPPAPPVVPLPTRPVFPPPPMYLPRSLIPMPFPMVPGLSQQTPSTMPGQPCVPFGAMPPGSQPAAFAAVAPLAPRAPAKNP